MYLREELEAARAVLVSRKEEALAAAAAELSKAAVLNMFLAGSLAHEFLAHGTVLGGAADRGSAELSCLLVANGAHLPGLVNPAQLLLPASGSGAVDPTKKLVSHSTEDETSHVHQTKGDDDPMIAAEPEDSMDQQPSSTTGGERYEIYKSLLACNMADGCSASVSQHVLRVSGYMQRLEALGCPVSQELGAGLILAASLNPPSQSDDDSSLLQKRGTTAARAAEVCEIYQALFACKMAEGGSVDQHALRVSGYLQRLDELGSPVSQELGAELVLASLPSSYCSFVMNYNNRSKSVGELFAMLKTAAHRSGVQNHKEVHCVMTVNENTGFKKKEAKFSAESGVQKEVNRAMAVNKTIDFKKKKKANKSRKKGRSKGADGVTTPVTGPHPDAECFFCKEMGHWKRNCNKFLAEKKFRNSISGTMEA